MTRSTDSRDDSTADHGAHDTAHDAGHSTGAEGEPSSEAGGGAGRGSGPSWSRGLGILSAVRDALETTIQEARDRGDLSPDRAREIFDRAASRAREATAEARERLDLVPRSDFDALVGRVRDLEARLERLESDDPVAGSDREPSVQEE